MSLFDGIENSTVQRQSEFIRPGRYLFRIESIKTGITRKKVDFVAFNLLTLHVVDDTAAADDPKGAHRVGDRVTWMNMKTWDSFLSTIKTAIMGITGCKEDEVTSNELAIIVGPNQPLAGFYVEIDSRNVTTKIGSSFTRVQVKRSLDVDEVLTMVPPHIAEAFDIVK